MTFVFSLANDTDVRRVSFHSEKIMWEAHQVWFAQQLREKNPFYIAVMDGEPCGYVRMQQDRCVPKTDVVVSIAISPSFRSRGIAATALRIACKKALSETFIRKIWAMVKITNTNSRKLFTKACFQEAGNRVLYDTEAISFVYPGYME